LIVILIIGILVGIAVLAWVHSVRAAADKTRLANMKSVVSALNLYRYNTEHFPPNMDNDLQRVGRRCRRRLHP
jgi:type II secretory pathway pseudopilin PulG